MSLSTGSMKREDIQPGQHFVIATEGMRGHFACEMWINNTHEEYNFPESWQSDSMSYRTHTEAVVRAKELANELGIPYID